MKTSGCNGSSRVRGCALRKCRRQQIDAASAEGHRGRGALVILRERSEWRNLHFHRWVEIPAQRVFTQRRREARRRRERLWASTYFALARRSSPITLPKRDFGVGIQ